MSEIKISTSKCMCCDSNSVSNYHHIIPQHFNPKNNVVVGLCNNCHKRIHEINKFDMAQFSKNTVKNIEKEIFRLESLMSKIKELDESEKK